MEEIRIRMADTLSAKEVITQVLKMKEYEQMRGSGTSLFFCEGEIILKQEHNTSPKFYTQDPKEKENYRLVPGSHVHLLLQPSPSLPLPPSADGSR
jgi:hypothetical protein